MRRFLSLFLLALFSAAVFGQGGRPADVPAYHQGPPPRGVTLSPLLAPDQLLDPELQEAVQKHAYALAPKISSVLYQQPCYCRCDRAVGHDSLRSCFEGTHGAHCGTCLQELYYTYLKTKAGKTPAQIRQGIIRGEWESVDLAKAASIQ